MLRVFRLLSSQCHLAELKLYTHKTSTPLCHPLQLAITSYFISLTSLGTSCKWNRTVFVVLGLVISLSEGHQGSPRMEHVSEFPSF